jgi:hypothetical protein
MASLSVSHPTAFYVDPRSDLQGLTQVLKGKYNITVLANAPNELKPRYYHSVQLQNNEPITLEKIADDIYRNLREKIEDSHIAIYFDRAGEISSKKRGISHIQQYVNWEFTSYIIPAQESYVSDNDE